MVRRRAPAPLDAVEDSTTATEGSEVSPFSGELSAEAVEAPPVKNTFIDFTPEALLKEGGQAVTAPGRMVGRVNATFQHLATPTASGLVRPQRSTMSDSAGGLKGMPPAPLASVVESCPCVGTVTEGKKVNSPPPMHTPHVRPADRPMLQAPPLMSPKIPKDISLSSGGYPGIPPPPQASPVLKGSPLKAYNVAAPMLRADLANGSLIEVTPVGQVGPQMALPRCAPPSYMIGVVQTPTGGMGGYVPPPMHSPSCATPVSQSTTVRLLPGVAGSGSLISETAGHGQLLWPATPF